jgi:hypothetical protein
MKKRLKGNKSWCFLAVAIASLIALLTTFYLLGGLTIGIATVFTLPVIGPLVGYFIATKNGDEKGVKGAKLLLIIAAIVNFAFVGFIAGMVLFYGELRP